MALGAQRVAVVWMVLRRVLLLAAVGLAISVPAALSASRLVKSFLFETQPNDPGTLALAGVVLLSAAILAGYAPARRASRIDPLAGFRDRKGRLLRGATKDESVPRPRMLVTAGARIRCQVQARHPGCAIQAWLLARSPRIFRITRKMWFECTVPGSYMSSSDFQPSSLFSTQGFDVVQ